MDGAKQLTKNEFEKRHVGGQLKTGEHRLNDREYAIVKGLIDSQLDRNYGDRGTFFYSPKGGISKEEIHDIGKTLTEHHSAYGISKKQIDHVTKTLLENV